MIVPQPGWAEHRAEEDWWGDFVRITRALAGQVRRAARDDHGPSPPAAIGPCMLPVDAAGTPLMNGVLYGVDTRATAEIAALNAAIGEDAILPRCGNALTSQSVGPKILWLKRNRPDLWAQTAKVLTSTSYLVWKLTGEYVIDHYTAANFSPLYDVAPAGLVLRPAPTSAARPAAAPDVVDRDRGPCHAEAAAADRPCRRHARHLRHHRRGGRGGQRRRPRARAT